ncbi:hypothetical protein [Ornithobacterium rhinotracheale]|uniref:hypothetical protein n=5 Tax=Ornithobacterium rhinotracheale TaxID=28251 RepID=UPI003FD1BACB
MRKNRDKKMTYLQALGWLVGGWSAYKLYENVSKPKSKVEFGELELVGVEDDNFNADEALRKFDEQRAMLKLQFDPLEPEGKEHERWIFIELCKLVKDGKMEKNHAAAIMANMMIECHFRLLTEEPDYKFSRKKGRSDLTGKEKEYFMWRYGGAQTSYRAGAHGRNNLGNITALDGYTFRGRGFCQLTGRELYERAKRIFKIDFISNPELVLQKEYAFNIAVYFFMGWKGGFFANPKYVLPKVMPNGSADFSMSRFCLNPGETEKYSQVNRFGNAYLKLFNIVL